MKKQATDFHFLQSEVHCFNDPRIEESFFEEEKIAYGFEEEQNKNNQQENIIKTIKQKKGRKLSIKNNPQDNSPMKANKIKQKKYKAVAVDKEKNPNQLFGHWSTEENKRYHWFLQIYQSHFMNRSLRRMDRIFTSMAKFVGTREAQQCRSHHQKMEKKHKTFPKILLSLRMNFYASQTQNELKQQLERNQIPIVQKLLTQQYLMDNILTKQQLQNLSEHQGSSVKSEKQAKQKPYFNSAMVQQFCPVDVMDQMLVPDIQSSKCYFKFLSQKENNSDNILDDEYDKNLELQAFLN